MITPRSLIVILLLYVFCMLPARALAAGVVISEIMYDVEGADTDREWVELYNSGVAAVDLSKWKINDGSNHMLNEPPKNGGQGSRLIAPGGYMILAADATTFLAELSTSAAVVDTTLSLNNTSETVALIDADGATIDTATFSKESGAAGDGNSLQRQGGAWIAASPTLGRENAFASTPGKADSSKSSNAAPSPTPKPAAKTPVQSERNGAPESTVRLEAPTVAIVGDSVVFVATAAQDIEKRLTDTNTAWNFGDGTTGKGREAEHAYSRLGTYVAVLSVVLDGEEQVLRTTIVAQPPQISISQVEPGSKGFMILKNASSREVNLSHWRLVADTTSFRLPSGTIILPDAEVVFSAEATGLSVVDILTATLLFPSGAAAARFSEDEKVSPAKAVVREEVPAGSAATPPSSQQAEPLPEVNASLTKADDFQGSESDDSKSDDRALPATAAAAESGFLSGGLVPWVASLVALFLVAGAATLALRQSATASVGVDDQVENYTIIDDE